jgi:hypothetical protein
VITRLSGLAVRPRSQEADGEANPRVVFTQTQLVKPRRAVVTAPDVASALLFVVGVAIAVAALFAGAVQVGAR